MRVPEIEYVILSTRGDVGHEHDAAAAHRIAVHFAMAPKTAGERKRAVRVYRAVTEYDIGGHSRPVAWPIEAMLAEVEAGRASVDGAAEALGVAAVTVEELLAARARGGS